MESCKCPITPELFEDPVIGSDGYTYERKAIIDWLTKDGTSPMTREPMSISSLRTNYVAKSMIEELKSMQQSIQSQYQFELDVHIRRTRKRPLFQAFGKSIYEVEWINRDGPPIVLLKIDGAKANREASFYVNLSCHSHIVRTYGLVESNPDSVMLLQEMAPEGDLSELLRENEFKPTEQVLCTIFEQICDAMMFLADNRVVHGDLACRNVLVFQSNANEPRKNLVKLTDFGLTRASSLYAVLDSAAHTTMTIIPTRYAAPELLQNTDKLPYSEKSDVYSMGTLMWEACSYGQLPYANIHSDNDVRRRKLNDERLSQPPLCDEQLWVVINDCWHMNPRYRSSFQSLKESLLNFIVSVGLQIKPQLSSKTKNVEDSKIQEIAMTITQSNQSEKTSNRIVHIPCEICHQSIDIPNWAKHIQHCLERERQRLADRARSMSQEPVTEELPCEHCQQLFPPKRLQQHEIHCPKNPRNTVPSRKPPGQRPSTHASLPTKSNDRRQNPAQQNDRSNINPRFAQYQSIDVDRTHQANRDQDQMPRSRSSEDVLHHEDSSGNFYTYDNQIREQNGDRRYENASRSSNGRPQRAESFDNLRSRDDGYDSSNRSAGNRCQYPDKRRGEDQRNLVIINYQSDRPYVKEKKPSFIKELLGCENKSRRIDD